ncbi:redoxin domain-containing protein [Arcticibacter sp. MXS-1]|uniref:redoxin domain-containing protein n=1 Tax=Arcticibacter sp. MXS-1 TaxID=3341726 RepID=UPI0035A8EC17
MKSLLFVSVITLFSISGSFAQTAREPVVISGTVDKAAGEYVYLRKFQDKLFVTLDSAKIKDNAFVFKKELQIPELYGLSTTKEQSPFYLFVDSKNTRVKLNTDDYKSSVVEGSPSQDLFVSFSKSQDVEIADFIKKHPSSIVTAYVLYRNYSYRLSPEEIDRYVSQLAPQLQESQYARVLHELSKTLRTVEQGRPAPDFALNTPEGKEIRLSDFKGKYVLVDFWASWCPPCREDNPNVVQAYNKYKDKGFEILGVSLDRNKASWEKAIRDDKLTWTHVSDLAYWKSKAAAIYGVRAIPANVLVAPDGKIVGKNLRGEELQAKLQEIYAGK